MSFFDFAKELTTAHASLLRTTVLTDVGEAEVCLGCDGAGCADCNDLGISEEDLEALLGEQEERL